MTGRVCERHQEYAPSGVCRWCEPPTAKPLFVRVDVTAQTTATIGGLYGDFALVNTNGYWRATGGVPAVRQANGLVLPARLPAIDPTVRADLEAAWDALYPKAI